MMTFLLFFVKVNQNLWFGRCESAKTSSSIFPSAVNQPSSRARRAVPLQLWQQFGAFPPYESAGALLPDWKETSLIFQI
jgi:hypothetical protein